jgi:hypothetical protein
MEFVKTLRWLKVYVNYAYFWATIPFKLDLRTRSFVISQSRAHSVRYVVTMGLIVAEKVTVLLFLLRDILSGNFVFKDRYNIVKLLIAFFSFYVLGNHLQNIWRAPQIASMLNSFIRFYDNFGRKYSGEEVS